MGHRLDYLAERELKAIDELIGRKQGVNPTLDYAAGWRLLASERPDLMESYGRAATTIGLDAINQEIEKRQAANPKMDYPRCWTLLASERSELITAYNLAASRQPPLSRAGRERRGLSGNGQENEDQTVALSEINAEMVKLQAANPRLDSFGAWALIARTRPELIANYNAAASGSKRRVGSFYQTVTMTSGKHPLAAVLVPIEEQINLKTQAHPDMSYGDAWKLVEREHPDLIANYNKAAGHPPNATNAEILARNRALIDEQIRNKRQENPSLTYLEASNLVEKEYPDLFWAYNDALSRRQSDTPGGRTAPVEEGGPGAQKTVAMRANPLASELAAIDEQIAAERRANPKINYGDGWLIVSQKRPDLIRAYNTAASRVFVSRG